MIHILYVDDEEILLDLARIFLERTGEFSVVTSPTAIGLIESGNIDSYDAIISDYMMPEMDGIAFLKSIRSKYPEIPFILFTGRGREEVVIEAINNGADFYLQKGGDPKAQFAELGHKVAQAVKRRKAEQELILSENRFSQIFQANPIIASLSELKTGKYLEVNEAFQKKLSYTREEVIGKSSVELGILSPEKRRDLYNRVLADHRVHNLEMEIVTKNGESLQVLFSAEIITSKNEEILLVQAIDITENKKSELALKESEERLRSFITNTTEAIILVDEEGNIIEWNPAAEKISGISKEDALGISFVDYIQSMFGSEKQNHEIILFLIEKITSLLKTGIPVSDKPIRAKMNKPDGTTIYISLVSFPIPTVKGFRFGIIIDDITNNYIAEERIKETLDNLKRSQNIAKIGTWSLDLGTRRYTASDEAYHIYNLQPGSVVTLDLITEMIHPDDKSRMKRIFHEALRTGKPYNAEMRVILPNTGEEKYLTTIGEIELDNNGKAVRVFGVDQDITELKKTSSALQEHENQFKKIIDNFPVSISIVTIEGKILYVNPQAVLLFELDNQEMISPVFASDIWKEPKKRTEWIEKILETGVETDYEAEFVTPSGKKLWVILFGIDIIYQGQRCILSAHHNITDRKQAEEELRKSEERYRFIADNTTDVIWIMDLNGRFTFVSPSVYHLRGYRPEEVLAGNISDAICPDILPRVKKNLQNAIAQIKSGKKPEADISEIKQPCKDGSTVWTEAVTRTLVDKRGEPIGFIGVSRDITKRKAAEQARKESEEKFISIFNQTPDPIIILNPEGKILEVNRGFSGLFGLDDTSVVGKRLESVGIITDLNQDFLTLNHDTKKTGITRIEMSFLNKDKNPFIAEVAISRILIQGKMCNLLQIHDIDEIRKAHNAVKNAIHKLNILSSITRHDILNRVMIASSYSEEMKEQVTDPKLKKYLETVHQASVDISHLIRLTKEYEDIGTNAPVWQQVDTRLHEQTILGLAKNCNVKSELGTLEIYADLMLEKVLYNLVDNSVRYGKNLSTISLFYRILENECLLFYEDDGGGVPDDEKEKIFERGFGKNTGMGLFLIREILSITGITIRETGKYGKGARFEITIQAGKWRVK